jgi:hypothetical protein
MIGLDAADRYGLVQDVWSSVSSFETIQITRRAARYRVPPPALDPVIPIGQVSACIRNVIAVRFA